MENSVFSWIKLKSFSWEKLFYKTYHYKSERFFVKIISFVMKLCKTKMYWDSCILFYSHQEVGVGLFPLQTVHMGCVAWFGTICTI